MSTVFNLVFSSGDKYVIIEYPGAEYGSKLEFSLSIIPTIVYSFATLLIISSSTFSSGLFSFPSKYGLC